jgi:hypothetical protein
MTATAKQSIAIDASANESEYYFINIQDYDIADLSSLSPDDLDYAIEIMHEQGFKTHPVYQRYYDQRRANIAKARGIQESPMQATDTTVAQAKLIDDLTHAEIEVKSLSPEELAVLDVRLLDIIEDKLLDCKYNAVMTDDIVLAIQAFMQNDSTANQSALALIADSAKLRGVFKFVQKIKNSPEFVRLVALNTPDETISINIPTEQFIKGEVVATNTTAAAIVSEVKPEKSESGKGGKKYPSWAKVEKNPANYYLQLTRESGSVDQLTIDTLISQYTTRGDEELAVFNEIKANGFATHNTLFLEICQHNPSSSEKPKSTKGSKGKPKTQQKLPMPALATIADIEKLDRKGLVEAVKAIKTNDPDVTLRANAASVDLQKFLASYMMKVDYTPVTKASKSKAKAIIDLPEGLTWEECKGMKYRQLQQICKALKSQGLFTGNVGGKGATTENLLKGCADYFKSLGQDIVEAKMSPSNEIKPLKLPNLERALADRKAKEAVAA